MAGIAASIALVLVFYLGRSTAEQPSLVAEKTEVTKDSVQPKHEDMTPTERTEQAVVAQATPTKRATVERSNASRADSALAAENLSNCIARLEVEMESLDDSVSSAQVERLIAADFRLQQMVNRIVGKGAEQAMNKLLNDSTTNYVSF